MKLKKEIYDKINNVGYSSNARGELAEDIAEEFFKQQNYNYMKLHSKELQKMYGDFLIGTEKNEKFVDVKNATTYRKENYDFLGIDYKYFKNSYNWDKYIQKDDVDNEGWIKELKAHSLFLVNHDNKTIYIILGWRNVASNILNYADVEFNKLKLPLHWKNKTLTVGVNANIKEDYNCNKITLLCNLKLDKEVIEKLGGKLLITKIECLEENSDTLF